MEHAPKDMPPFRDWRAWLAYAASHDAHPFIQFVKYGMAGVGALATDLLFFYLAKWLFFPIEAVPGGLQPESWSNLGPWLSEMAANQEVRNYVACSLAGFATSIVVAYWLNIKWVFKPGKHNRSKEITLFVLVSLVAFVIGTAFGAFLLGSFGWRTEFAKAGNIVGAVLINYVCRKFLIFHG